MPSKNFNQQSREPLYCTFTTEENLNDTLSIIKKTYNILYNKIYVFNAANANDFIIVCTYNVNTANVSKLIPHTLLAHRHKATNTIYTVDGLNALIRQLNKGILDKNFPINWVRYTATLIMEKEGKANILKTRVRDIIEIN